MKRVLFCFLGLCLFVCFLSQVIDVVSLSVFDSTRVVDHAVAFLPAEFRGKELNIDLVLRHLHQMSAELVSSVFRKPCKNRRLFELSPQYSLHQLFPH